MPDLFAVLNPWYVAAARDLPWRRTGFSAWGTLVSEVMLQQTQSSRVAVEIDRWLDRWPTPEALSKAPTSEVLRQWGSLGYPRRALRLQEAARAIVTEHNGEVPADVDTLLALPGIGDYTARAVAVFHFHARHPVVDTNVRRVLARYLHGRANQGTPRRSDLTDAESLLPLDPDKSALVCAALMELGALVCTSRTPHCSDCPLRRSCRWLSYGCPDNAPTGRPRQPRYEGSHRQARGRILAVLRAREGVRLTETDVAELIPDEAQHARAVSSLIADGLITSHRDNTLTLP